MVKFHFRKLRGLKFDIGKLKDLYFNNMHLFGNNGIKNISAINLKRIPELPKSTGGNYLQGSYWTMYNGGEVKRASTIPEDMFTQFDPLYEGTYFHELHNKISEDYTIGRFRLLQKEPRTVLSWHRDPDLRIHIPIITNPGCKLVVGGSVYHLPADGHAYLVNTKQYHTVFNGGESTRIHLVANVISS